jgi:ABC-type sugar transport system substrate-binding protein
MLTRMAAALAMLTSVQAAEKLALVPESAEDWYSNQLAAGCVEATAKVGAEKCIYVAPPSNDADVAIEKQIAIVDGLVAQNVDGIVVEPADPKALVPALRKACRLPDRREGEFRTCIQSRWRRFKEASGN